MNNTFARRFSYSTKGNRQLIINDKYKYNHNHTDNDDNQRFVCSTKRCLSFFKLNKDEQIIDFNYNHNHLNDHSEKIQKFKITNQIIQQRLLSNVSTKQCLNQIADQYSIDQLPKESSVRSTVNRKIKKIKEIIVELNKLDELIGSFEDN